MSHDDRSTPISTIEITYPEGRAPLYYRRPRELEPARGMLRLDLEADPPTLTLCRGRYLSDGTPESEWLGRVLTWSVDPCLTEGECERLLDRVAPLAEQIVAGYDTHWDGNNRRGRLDEDAREAAGEIAILCRDTEGSAQVWLVGDWLGTMSPSEMRRLGSTPEEIAGALEGEATSQGLVIDGDIEAYVREELERAAEVH